MAFVPCFEEAKEFGHFINSKVQPFKQLKLVKHPNSTCNLYLVTLGDKRVEELHWAYKLVVLMVVTSS